jgi:hypothetical protein
VGEFTTDGRSTSHNPELHITLPPSHRNAGRQPFHRHAAVKRYLYPDIQQKAPEDRSSLEKIFKESIFNDRAKRDRRIREAVEKFGYTQRAVADHLGLHFTYVSRILNER